MGSLAIDIWHRRVVLNDPLPQASPRSDEILDRLDPNTADAVSLSAIPNLGEKRAAEIVEYRQKFVLQHPGQHAFDSADDLLRLDGIGVATVTSLRPFLTFPNDNAAHFQSQDIPQIK